jgi:RNA polymerase sigma-70 factor, ECF subfamily
MNEGALLNTSELTGTMLGTLPASSPGKLWRRKPSHSVSQVEKALPRKLHEQTDEELMLLCQAEKPEALEELFRRYSGQLYQFIYRQMGNADTAADLVQETFLRVYNHRKNYRPTSRFTYWLYRIAKNLCVDEKRRYWNRNVSSSVIRDASEGGEVDLIDLQSSTSPDGASLVQEQEMEGIIREAIESLSEEQRQVMLLHKYQGLAYKEIAEILDISTESVKQRAYRAHLKLREQLEHLLEERED